jgi:superfamily I DNA/RNA helicase
MLKNDSIILTQEQQDIMDAVLRGESLLIHAFAGTGKTTTLSHLSRLFPEKKGLYLAYNADLKRESSKKFPSSVTCLTFHGLAYHWMGKRYRSQIGLKQKSSDAIKYNGISSFHFDYEGFSSSCSRKIIVSEYVLYALARKSLTRYYHSSDAELTSRHFTISHSDIVIPLPKGQLTGDVKGWRDEILMKLKHALTDRILQYAHCLLSSQRDPFCFKSYTTHDAYLKFFQLDHHGRAFDAYDYVMVDESQDLNDCMKDITYRCDKQIIYVGDPYQRIYGFRGASSVFNETGLRSMALTQSFRFGEPIAHQANILLKRLGSSMDVKGNPSVTSCVSCLDEIRDISYPYTIIARCNATLLMLFYLHFKQNGTLRYRLEGNLKKIISFFSDIYFLYQEDHQRIKDPFIRGHKTLQELAFTADCEGDFEISVAIQMIQKNPDDVMSLIRSLDPRRNPMKDKADVTFVTAHGSKGLEYDTVIVCADFYHYPENTAQCVKDDRTRLHYVAVTRPRHVLYQLLERKDDDEKKRRPFPRPKSFDEY